ncbi:BRCT domain protein [Aspergillus brunneoviolaceus CBS 621.78]|uniref:BRCT domain protein n=1 Tax=Aspergillus brunneoviolaceus CBS 621.78 TaxID=1450534 RepID=A0ACD1FVJ0_9EURO|nr:BRCT domain protein [Aspergillus brunneoviolaceus CBS 621.78]RAH40989.1 BRCT domain protein [Aspergillus brunneoviolaceus CBS 621.78]
MGKTFHKIHASSAGKFPKDGDKIPQWIRANGGEYHSTITPQVTHLITTLEAYKKNIAPVREAKALKNIKIVTFDWLEDSLLAKDKKPKRANEYLLETILKGEEKRKRKPAREASRTTKSVDAAAATTRKAGAAKKPAGRIKNPDPFGKATAKFKAGAAAAKYCIYVGETTGIKYDIPLVRFMACRRSREKIRLKVYESKAEPHVYATRMEYSRTGATCAQMLTPLGTSLKIAMDAFEAKFMSKTGVAWADRSNGVAPPPKMDKEGNPLPADKGWYFFEDGQSILSQYLHSHTAVEDQGHEVETAGGASLV